MIRFCVYGGLRIADHLYRRRQGRAAAPGLPIEQLAEDSDHLETCYLLLYGELPNKQQKDRFVSTVHRHTMVHEQIRTFFGGFRRDAHPMAIMCGVVGALRLLP